MTHKHSGLAFCATLCVAACGNSVQPGTTRAAGGSSGGGAQAGATGGVAGSGGNTAAAGAETSGGFGGVSGAAGSSGATGSGGTGLVGTCTPPKPEDMYAPITKLSQTGCVDPTDPKKPAANAVGYEVNSPLWSDKADKSRTFVLPAGKQIHVRNCTATPSDCATSDLADDGRWDFPIGSVMIKSFMFDGKLVETRLFMHMGDDSGADAGWIGYGYQWDEAQTDATIVPSDRQDVMFNTGVQTVRWHYPSRQDCMDCHNTAAGSTLGPETAQMNRMTSGVNQLDAFAAKNLFDTPPTKPYKVALVTPYAGQLGNPPASATTEQEARSYLHANCGFCHRPGGKFDAFDTRYDTAFKNSNLCKDGTQGPIGANPSLKILSPGHSADSLLIERMNLTNDAQTDQRMPQIGSYVVDTTGTTLVAKWIDALTTCN